MPKTPTTPIEDEENPQMPAEGSSSKDPNNSPTHTDEDDQNNILSADEAQQEYFGGTGLEEDTTEDEFIEGKPVEAKKPDDATPAPTVTPDAQSEEASNIAKGLNADGTPKVPTPEPVVPPAPQLDANGQPIAPSQEPAPVQAAAPQPTQTPDPEAPPTPEQVTEYYRNWRENTETALANTHYKLTQEQCDELDANPAAFIQKFAAKVYLDALTASLAQVNANLPRMVHQINEQAESGKQREGEFYSRWPALKAHDLQVRRIAKTYRENNPQATLEDFINEVGAAAMIAMRIPMPQTNGNGKPVASASPPPFKPASSTPPSGNNSAPPANMFEQLNDSFDETLDDD